MPIANNLLLPEQFNQEYFYDMAIAFCEHCYALQLLNLVEPDVMYHDNYTFFSGLSKNMTLHFQDFAKFVQQQYLAKEAKPFVVEVGSNDGILLQNFANQGMHHLGVDPSANVAAIAEQKGVKTLVDFFHEDVADKIIAEHGKADAILGANAICHIDQIGSVAAGVNKLLKPQGVFVFEAPYLGEIIKKTSYDQIYDEHVFFFSLHAVKNLFSQHDLELIDAYAQNVHGGSMRYVLAHKGAYPITDNVINKLEAEKQQGLTQLATFQRFAQNVAHSKQELVKLLTELKAAGKRVVGYAATAKSSTILNYSGIGPDLLSCIYDITPTKQGKFSPGMHIPVKPFDEFHADYPDYALLFAWNHANEIMAKETAFAEQGGKWIVHIPEVQILDLVTQ